MKLLPSGLWKGPLTDEQVLKAIAFGTETAKAGEMAIHDWFVVEVNQELNAVISISTAFERIAAYAGQQASCSDAVDPAIVEALRSNPIFETHYALDFVSPHKLLSVLRFWAAGSDAEGKPRPFPNSYEKMRVVYRSKLGEGRYRQTVAFPYREELDGSECFEVAVQKLLFLSTNMTRLWVHLREYH